MRVWRISKVKYASAAFSGEGARLFSGRWSPTGIGMVYCSSSLALASLELFVHLDPSVAPDDLVSVMAEVPQAKIEDFDTADLALDWRMVDNLELQAIGSEWIRSMRSVALLVPSAVVDGETNLLLNPAHPDFNRVVISEPKPFHFDERMFFR